MPAPEILPHHLLSRLTQIERRAGASENLGIANGHHRPYSNLTSATLRQRTGRSPAADGRITVLVSHRFTTVRMADLIVVLDGTRVVEVGTHDDLVAKGGQYAEVYGIQAAADR